ncbi:hypothetical protein ACEYW6_23880 [Nostoc sp. UIC 10607]
MPNIDALKKYICGKGNTLRVMLLLCETLRERRYRCANAESVLVRVAALRCVHMNCPYKIQTGIQ